MNNKKYFLINNVVLLTVAVSLMGCSSTSSRKSTDSQAPLDREERRFEKTGKLLGAEGLLFGGDSNKKSSSGVVGVRVNPYLWKAALDVLSFMPLVSVDANGGVLITDWYMGDQKVSERVKVTVEITSTELKVQSLKVLVHKQKLNGSHWVNIADVDRETSAELENIILSKARNLRMKDK